ncbi:MAG: (Fe-S)-binding protein, partial [Candidatus Micrarchaeaceae archaeon]
PKSQEIARSDSILQNIYKMTSRVGDDIGYLYEDEPYSGSILYELGFMDEFKTYGSKMYELFKTKNVEQIVTVDPHTTNTLSNLKKHIQFDIPFVSYLNLVKDSQGNGEFVLHDSCLYSRFLNMHDTIREVLAKSGLKLVEDEFTTGKRFGVCCGAPVGPLDGSLSDSMARMRMKSLNSLSKNVLVACPLCYVSLSPYGNVKDIAEVIK